MAEKTDTARCRPRNMNTERGRGAIVRDCRAWLSGSRDCGLVRPQHPSQIDCFSNDMRQASRARARTRAWDAAQRVLLRFITTIIWRCGACRPQGDKTNNGASALPNCFSIPLPSIYSPPPNDTFRSDDEKLRTSTNPVESWRVVSVRGRDTSLHIDRFSRSFRGC